jgi:cysteine desulfurase
MTRIYLDHAATTPVDPEVVEAMFPHFSGGYGNASSIHWHGRQGRQALEGAREIVSAAIGAQPGELFFTSGGTESDNIALVGCATAAAKKGNHIVVTSQAEHHAVLDTCEHLGTLGFEVRILPVDTSARVSSEEIRGAVKGAGLVSIMMANNEVGTISPMTEIASACRENGALFHSDAVQAFGKIPVEVNQLGVDLLSISAHKIYGPKGIGALYVRKGTEIEPVMHGGGQERGKRPGTEPVALAVGFARATEIALRELTMESARLQKLRDSLQRQIVTTFPQVLINGDQESRLPHILNISFDRNRITFEGDMLLMNMDMEGVSLTSGSACTSGSMQPSHVLLAAGRDERTARASLRFSFGKANTEQDVDEVVRIMKVVVDRMVGGS